MIILRNHFSVTEVLARIKVNIRRSTHTENREQENETLVIGDLVMNLRTDYTVTKRRKVDLTAKEYETKTAPSESKKVYTKNRYSPDLASTHIWEMREMR